MGVLLKQFDGKGNNQHNKDGMGAHTTQSQREVADSVGISKHQQVQAVRVANVPDEQYDGRGDHRKSDGADTSQRGARLMRRLPRLRAGVLGFGSSGPLPSLALGGGAVWGRHGTTNTLLGCPTRATYSSSVIVW